MFIQGASALFKPLFSAIDLFIHRAAKALSRFLNSRHAI
jgi:hypothetical protein